MTVAAIMRIGPRSRSIRGGARPRVPRRKASASPVRSGVAAATTTPDVEARQVQGCVAPQPGQQKRHRVGRRPAAPMEDSRHVPGYDAGHGPRPARTLRSKPCDRFVPTGMFGARWCSVAAPSTGVWRSSQSSSQRSASARRVVVDVPDSVAAHHRHEIATRRASWSKVQVHGSASWPGREARGPHRGSLSSTQDRWRRLSSAQARCRRAGPAAWARSTASAIGRSLPGEQLRPYRAHHRPKLRLGVRPSQKQRSRWAPAGPGACHG